jgi:LacI family transcriptional regulator
LICLFARKEGITAVVAHIPKVILLIESSRAYGRGLLRGIAKYARLHGPWMFYSEPEYTHLSGLGLYRYGRSEELMPRLEGWKADGIIARISNPEKSIKILPKKVPVIAIPTKNKIVGLPHLVSNETKVSEMTAEYLLARGFTNFGFCGFNEAYWSQTRSERFCETIAQAGYKTYLFKYRGRHRKPSWDQELHAIASWLKSVPKPIAVMACNDTRARHVIEACKEAGLSVPEEVAIIGANNDETVCELSDPPLSSVALNTEKAGYETAELLDRLMSGEKMAEQIIVVEPTHIVSRQSTDILAIKDGEVTRAIGFIRQNIKNPIQVADVAAYTTLSRRTLQKRFRTELRRSILQEIRRVRVQEIIRLLMETHMSISEIAVEMGYPGPEHISRHFRKATGMSLLAYRKRYSLKHFR